MKILFVGLKDDYADPSRGPSFEWHNFVEPLRRCSDELLALDSGALARRLGPTHFSALLEDTVRREKPDLLFTVLFEEEYSRDVMRRITDDTETATFNWFCDDHWRFEGYSRHWAPSFDLVSTTSKQALDWYAREGLHNVVRTQWAANPFVYHPSPLSCDRDVTFVGQPHGHRRELIRDIERAGVHVELFGNGWGNGRITQEAMVEVFARSRINLNLSNASSSMAGPMGLPAPSPSWTRHRLARALPGPIRSAGNRLLLWRSARAATRTAQKPAGATPAALPSQIKGRNFEVPACGGFLLTDLADDLQDYYRPGKEIALYEGIDDLVQQVEHYLANEDERAAIAQAGLQRTLAEHTYFHRFTDIFARLGLAMPHPQAILAGDVPAVPIREIGP